MNNIDAELFFSVDSFRFIVYGTSMRLASSDDGFISVMASLHCCNQTVDSLKKLALPGLTAKKKKKKKKKLYMYIYRVDIFVLLHFCSKWKLLTIRLN